MSAKALILKAGQKEVNDELGSLGLYTRVMPNSTPASPDRSRSSVSVVPYALFVPVLAVMAQSAWIAQGWSLRNTLLWHVFHPVILLSMTVVAFISYFVLRPFAGRQTARRVVFVVCVAVFAAVALFLTPGIAE